MVLIGPIPDFFLPLIMDYLKITEPNRENWPFPYTSCTRGNAKLFKSLQNLDFMVLDFNHWRC